MNDVADADQVTLLDRDGPNSIAVSNGVIADEWSLWIVRQALGGITRYSDWLSAGPIPGSALTTRLASLVEARVLVKVPYSDRPVRYEYHVSRRGRQLWPILVSMWAWEKSWVNDETVNLPHMRHTTCGEFFEPLHVCQTCTELVISRDVVGRLGPSGDWFRSIPPTATRRRSRTGERPREVVNDTMKLIGDRWSMVMLGAAFLGANRFSDFEQRMGASPTIVADRLRVFCELDVLRQVPGRQRADRLEYQLTPKGRAFFPVIVSTLDWGERWFRSPEGPALILEHSLCSNQLHSRLLCSACREPLQGRTVETVRTDAD